MNNTWQAFQSLERTLELSNMFLPHSTPQPLLPTLASMVRTSESQLHERILRGLKDGIACFSLPARLRSLESDMTIVQDYAKYPFLVHFSKITLEMVSALYQTKIYVYSKKNRWLDCQMVSHPSANCLRIARIDNNYYTVMEHTQKGTEGLLPVPQLDSANYMAMVEAFTTETVITDDQNGVLATPIVANKEEEDLIVKECNNVKTEEMVVDNTRYYQMYYPQPNYYEPYMQYIPRDTPPYRDINEQYRETSPSYRDLHYPEILSPSYKASPTKNPPNCTNQTGRLKFFDQGKNYGFIIMDADGTDIFVHYDDLQKAGITKDAMRNFKQNQMYLQIRFSFKVMEYFGKYKKSRKAVDLIIVGDNQLESNIPTQNMIID